MRLRWESAAGGVKVPGSNAAATPISMYFSQRAVMTHHHPVGTCRMGEADGSVVDADLKLYGFEGLHLVDASVIPTITSGPIHASVLAIAETFAAEIGGPLLA